MTSTPKQALLMTAPVLRRRTAPILVALLVALARTTQAQATLTSGALDVRLNAEGAITALRNTVSGRDYLARDTAAPLLTLVSDGTRLAPTSLTLARTPSGGRLTLNYATAGVRITLLATETPTHLRLEVVSAAPEQKVDAIIWGPYPTVIRETVGEIIGVVRDGQVALGLQVLNMKTLGGDLPNSEGSTWARGIAARATPWGSTMQAYAINRNRDRLVDAWGGNHPRMPVPALKGETVVGAKIALFTCAESETLDRLERIAVTEGLPHPTIDGVWFPRSSLFERSYMISSFGEADVDEMIAYAKRAGLFSLYHEGPFKSWGHFELDQTQFPGGRAGMKAAVDKARAAGLHLGVHTLTNFINTNDPYVTPVPDVRLAVTGSSTLVANVDASQREIEVRSPEYFRDSTHNHLHTVRIGTELIQYKSVSPTAPYVLRDAQRGAFGTTAAAHRAGDPVGKLLDHSYKVFFPNFAMQREVAKNLADFLNETGVDHIDFDGHEGALASGEGDYALAVFARDVLDQVRHDLINGTSISKTFYWHIGSYYNWGEPWYGGFRESMQQYRIDNQALFDRNFMPHMLGWYLMTEHTTLAEMEWMLARAAGYRAGFAMVARPRALRANPRTPVLLDAIREWETARTRQAFSAEQQARLKDPANEFHLERIGDASWTLQQYAVSPTFVRQRIERQPGEPTHSAFEFQQPWPTQRLQFRLTVAAGQGTVRNISLQIDGYTGIALPLELAGGESLVCDGTETVQVYDAQGKPRSRVSLTALPPMMEPGAHRIFLDSAYGDDEAPKVELLFKGLHRTDTLRANAR